MYAITRRLDEFSDVTVDLNDDAAGDGYLFVRDGIGIAGRGVAARLDVDGATEALRSIGHDTSVEGHGPIAIGVVPFRPGAPGAAVLAEVTVRKSVENAPTITVVGSDADHARTRLDGAMRWITDRPLPATVTASSYTIEPGVAIDHYVAAVVAARDATRSG